MNTVANELKIETRAETCGIHGAFESRNIIGRIWTKCPKCAGEREATEKAEAEKRERIAKREAWQREIGAAGIPERFQDRSLQSFKAATDPQRRALAFAEAYADGFDDVLKTGRSATFIGMPGTGKTHLACGIGLRIMQRDNRTVLFTTVMRAIRRIKATWSKRNEESESEAIESLVAPDLLILDEVGIQFGSETENLMLFDVLNERYEKRRPVLLLSNLTLEEVSSYLGERIFDRLREDGGEVVVFDWESHRGKASANGGTSQPRGDE